MIKKFIWGILSILFVVLIWYLFIKPYDYTIRFKANTTIGTVNQSLKLWARNLKQSKELNQLEFDKFDQKLIFQDSIYWYRWEMEAINDSTTLVKARIKEPARKLMNRLSVPFVENAFVKQSKFIVRDFYQSLSEHLKQFKVTIVGEEELTSTYCAYIPLKGLQIEKAKGMMRNYSLLSQVLLEAGVELNGRPFVEVEKWDLETDSIYYNFCYPIIRSEKLPLHSTIKYKRFFAKKTIKAIYNGNYITSDRAWYSLINYAEKEKHPIELKPIEFFISNPNFGGNELEWIAEIYMPLKTN